MVTTFVLLDDLLQVKYSRWQSSPQHSLPIITHASSQVEDPYPLTEYVDTRMVCFSHNARAGGFPRALRGRRLYPAAVTGDAEQCIRLEERDALRPVCSSPSSRKALSVTLTVSRYVPSNSAKC